MNKQEMIKSFQRETGSLFITRKQLAKVMGYKDAHSVDRYLAGLEKVERKYFIPEVIEEITRRTQNE